MQKQELPHVSKRIKERQRENSPSVLQLQFTQLRQTFLSKKGNQIKPEPGCQTGTLNQKLNCDSFLYRQKFRTRFAYEPYKSLTFMGTLLETE